MKKRIGAMQAHDTCSDCFLRYDDVNYDGVDDEDDEDGDEMMVYQIILCCCDCCMICVIGLAEF